MLREPTETFLTNQINSMLKDNGEKIVSDMLTNEVDRFLETPVSQLVSRHEKQLAQVPDSVMSVYKRLISEHLPRILNSIDIRRIVTERINDMDLNELEQLTLKVMNKELKAIVWFGAGLGAIIGCINIFV